MKQNNQFKILYQKIYFGRVLFVVLDRQSNKVMLLYRSSGFSGTGHKDELLPFFLLNGRVTIRGTPLGYIHKEMMFNDKFTSHYKNLSKEIIDFIKPIKDLVKDIQDKRTIEEINEDLEQNLTSEYVSNINTEIVASIKDYKLFDYGKDIL